MRNTRRVLFAQNTELQSRLAACGPDMTLSRKQLHQRLDAARSEVDSLTARVSALTAQNETLNGELTQLKSAAKAAEEAKKQAA